MDIANLLLTPVFTNIPQTTLEEFLRQTPSAERVFNKGEIIVTQGSPCQSLYILLEGKVRTFMANSEGKQLTIEDIRAPHLLAPAFLYASNNRFPVNIEALTDVSLLILSRKEFNQLMHREPVVMENFLRIISDRSIFLSNKIQSFALQSLKNRLAEYLLYKDDSPTTQQEIADTLGVARPSLSRIIAELVSQGILKSEKRNIVIIDKERLRNLLK